MKKEKIIDAAVITASAIAGSELVDIVDDLVDAYYVDDRGCVYGPPPGYIPDDLEIVPENDNDDVMLDPVSYDIDDTLCVYGPPPEMM